MNTLSVQIYYKVIIILAITTCIQIFGLIEGVAGVRYHKYEDEIIKLSDHELQEYIESVPIHPNRGLAIEEFNRRQLHKLGKTSLVGWITLGLVVASFIISILTFIFTFLKNKT